MARDVSIIIVVAKNLMSESKHIGLHIVEYLLNNCDGDVSDPVLVSWLSADDSNRTDFEAYKKIWKASRYYTETKMFDHEHAWQKVHRTLQRKESRHKQLAYMYYALSGAAAAIAIFFTLSYTGILRSESAVEMTVDVAYGNHSEVTLPDGSTVKLNAGSHAHYISNPRSNIRQLQFSGEGWFDVAKSKRPFVITVNDGLQIRVLGTTFNLSAYDDDATAQASLVEGSIEMSHGDDHLLITPGQAAVYNLKTKEITSTSVTPEQARAWIDKKIYMDETPLEEICKKLERHYDVHITLTGDIGTKLHYNGVLQEESIDDVMNALARTGKIKYAIKGRFITVSLTKPRS